MALLKDEPRLADIVAEGDVECFTLSKEKVSDPKNDSSIGKHTTKKVKRGVKNIYIPHISSSHNTSL